MSTLSRMVRRMIWSRRVFEFWQRLGVNVTPKHFYSPIPDTRRLAQKEALWSKPSELPGMDMNVKRQLHFLQEVFAQYKSEFDFPVDKPDTPQYYLNNAAFGLEDAEVLHCMIRHFKPRTIVEVGSGFSTFVSARAGLMNRKEDHPCKLISIEPYPRQSHRDGFAGLDEQIPKKAEEVDPVFFEQLRQNDILFIDSSHVVRTGGDVNCLFLEVLPRLANGAVVHVHDIFLPYEYPKQWVISNRAFWTEQYLLRGFLCFNGAYEVLFANHYMMRTYPDQMGAVFAHPNGYRQRNIPDSFWMRKSDGAN